MTAIALCPSCKRKHRTSKAPHALTKRQNKIHEVIFAWILHHHCTPTFRELAKYLNVSVTTIHEHVHNLNCLGLVTLKNGKSGRIVGANAIPTGGTK